MKPVLRDQLKLSASSLLVFLWSAMVFAQGQGAGNAPAPVPMPAPGQPGARPSGTMQAGSLFTNYVAGVTIYVLITGVLVAVLLIGAFLILNLGLLSKRSEDRVGGRTPSDVGILKTGIWPPEEPERRVLPAEEENGMEASAPPEATPEDELSDEDQVARDRRAKPRDVA